MSLLQQPLKTGSPCSIRLMCLVNKPYVQLYYLYIQSNPYNSIIPSHSLLVNLLLEVLQRDVILTNDNEID